MHSAVGLRSRSMAIAPAIAILVLIAWWANASGLIDRSIEILGQRAGFQIPESLFPVSAGEPLFWTLLAGLTNTVHVALMATILSVILGLVLAMLRLSSFPGFRFAAGLVIEPIRNTPVVLQLFLWYGLLINNLPAARDAIEILPSVFLSNRGLFLPGFSDGGLSVPELVGFNFKGGISVSPELTTLVFGLTLFHASYLAEIFRAGIMSVPRGQVDAAQALGLRFFQRMRLVVLPQALGFIIPPATNQFLALVKNSSLAVAIGFPDLVGVVNTLINLSGNAVLGTLIVVIVFLALNFVLSGGLALYHRHRVRKGNPTLAVSLSAPEKATWGDWVATPFRRIATFVLALVGAWLLFSLVRWGILDAVWSGTAEACHAASGACWAVITEKYRLMLLGPYPAGEGWRPVLATAVLILGLVSTAKLIRTVPFRAAGSAVAAVAIWYWLMGGGPSLTPVALTQWGGLPLTIALAVLTVFLSVPIGLALALARMSKNGLLRQTAYLIIDIFRSVPQIFLLFAIAILLPYVLPDGWQIDKFWRALFALTMITSAYMAEVFRAGIMSVPGGQSEAARSLGLGPVRTFILVVLPQAVRISWPAIINTFVGAIKDTSLVFIVGLLDILAATKAAVADPVWRLFSLEGYCFTAAIYFVICYGLVAYTRRFERLR
ncbi:ABC transporter permease subunit [Mesorhizobium sp. ZMM04-5]|uniref:ABC transporter permease subunit n=1 Tax=Mesorhizobium marinum TaxID=3228790 RepID=A0ABV3QYI6_9HYPH